MTDLNVPFEPEPDRPNVKLLSDWIEISYCSPATFGKGYSSGSHRLHEELLALWLREKLADGRPILITEIRTIQHIDR